MFCEQVEARLQWLLDNRSSIADFLESSDPQARHARGCPECRQLAEALELIAVNSRALRPAVISLSDEFGSPVWSEPTLAARVVASLNPLDAVAPAATQDHSKKLNFYRLPRGWVASALAASLLVAIGLGRLLAPVGGEADGPPVASHQVAAELPKTDVAQPRWYPRGVGIASISMAVLTSAEFDMRQAATPSTSSVEQPLLDRAVEAMRWVFPNWEPEAIPNSKTGVSLPELPLVV